ncbi:histidine phosphatase family protein [Aureimonas jatrophae]|jgi:2,3-bisphosphoglycerate-dependent phosphoglycerate mutase|uniref:Broad specificity phosphatase PhoE n=1 Tax=Aureimonas jatrophae TaxID=1166073 RepID=A0A1H0D781_9HYPH|nr:histidine phosphatase family protein [Aureimonas jatrophae]MBB3951742.1 broad specificity phosphatase PhoE [Aureimonas jatrophae]SDN66050.1 Broad specificity phosphatase PhoE [Aureimonas jatrophae]
MADGTGWPASLWIVRHGESLGNVARDLAMRDGLSRIDIEARDVDVPLSPLGQEQADAVGHWFAAMPADERPEIVLSSPYTRARQTAGRIVAEGGIGVDRVITDERLREKEFGVLDRLTARGIQETYPDQAEFRRILGKFYHRPPGGESWCDVILRLRSMLDTVALHYGNKRVLIVGHQVVVLCLRYVIERLDEEAILRIDRETEVANCGVTQYRREGDELALKLYNFTAPMQREGTPVTAEPDRKAAAG